MKFLLYLCTILSSESSIVVVYVSIIWNIFFGSGSLLNSYFGFVCLSCEIFTVIVYDCILWNISCGGVRYFIVKYLLFLCIRLQCDIFIVVVRDCIMWNICLDLYDFIQWNNYSCCVWLYCVIFTVVVYEYIVKYLLWFCDCILWSILYGCV